MTDPKDPDTSVTLESNRKLPEWTVRVYVSRQTNPLGPDSTVALTTTTLGRERSLSATASMTPEQARSLALDLVTYAQTCEQYDGGRHEHHARELALREARKREDSDDTPRVETTKFLRSNFIHVEVVYDKKGHTALYEYDMRTGTITVAQD